MDLLILTVEDGNIYAQISPEGRLLHVANKSSLPEAYWPGEPWKGKLPNNQPTIAKAGAQVQALVESLAAGIYPAPWSEGIAQGIFPSFGRPRLELRVTASVIGRRVNESDASYTETANTAGTLAGCGAQLAAIVEAFPA